MMREIFIPLPDEKELGIIDNAKPISGIHNVTSNIYNGSVVYTKYRIMYHSKPYKKEDFENLFYFMIPFEQLISVKIEREKAFFGIKKTKKLVLHYETIDGIVRKVYFQIPWDVSDSIVDDITAILNKAKEEEYNKDLMEPKLFNEFITFMYSEKGVSPLYYDPVSRAIKIGNSTFYIKKDLSIVGHKHILADAKRWLDEFLSRR